jgi:DNA-binding CsgD family transcriptional regulator
VSCTPRFLSLSQVQRELGLTRGQVTALIETGALPAFQILGEWRVEYVMLDRLVDRLYEQDADLAPGIVAAPPDSHPASLTIAPASRAPMDAMTPQQQRIGHLVGQGLSNAEIAQRLSLEISTVKSHISRMLQRLNLQNRQQLIAHLWRTGFVASPETETEALTQTITKAGHRWAGVLLSRWPVADPGRRAVRDWAVWPRMNA